MVAELVLLIVDVAPRCELPAELRHFDGKSRGNVSEVLAIGTHWPVQLRLGHD